MYDFAHGQTDAIEGITHSICTLEFESHRPLYEWFLDNLPVPARPRQYEFARLNLTYTVMSKRKLQELVQLGIVSGWDDPRLPTLEGLKRRGYTPAAVRNFCEQIGVGRSDSWIDVSILEECVRADLNESAPRAMAVLRPIKLVIDNYPADRSEELQAANHPQKPEMGNRTIYFSREIWIDGDDFMEVPSKGFPSPDRWWRGQAALRLYCEMYGCRQGRPGKLSWSCTASTTPLRVRGYTPPTAARLKGLSTGFPLHMP